MLKGRLLHSTGNSSKPDNNRGRLLLQSPALPRTCNMASLDNKLIAGASRLLQERLPPGWAIERVTASSRTPRLRITSKEGQSRELPVSALSRPDPRAARLIPKERPLLVTAPYLSQGVRETIEDEGASYVDQTGNVRLVLDEPGLFIMTSGSESNPWPEERRFTLRGTKAGRVVCALACAKPQLGVRELAAAADTDPGYVSRLLGMLDREAIVDRTGRGRVERIDWRKLLLRWSEEQGRRTRGSARRSRRALPRLAGARSRCPRRPDEGHGPQRTTAREGVRCRRRAVPGLRWPPSPGGRGDATGGGPGGARRGPIRLGCAGSPRGGVTPGAHARSRFREAR